MWKFASRRTATPSWMAITAALALALSACGGSDGGTPASGPPPRTTPPPAAAVKVDSLAIQTQPNTRYQVDTSLGGTVVLTLPLSTQLSVGDTVSVTGVSANAWRIAQNPGQLVQTSGLPGDPQAGDAWITTGPTGLAEFWWTAGASADGQTLLAAGNPGNLYLSRDAGDSWTQVGPSGNWSSAVSSLDGTHLAATRFNGQLWVSHDHGASWSSPETTRQWLSITVSDDGQRLAAVVKNGALYTSDDGGRTWHERAFTANWQAIAASADGQRLVAGVAYGKLYTSADGGLTWTPHESDRLWYRVASSGDGMRLVAAHSGGYLYVSEDGGQTWEPRFPIEGPVNAVAMSRDGLKILFARPMEQGLSEGRIYLSSDAGHTWQTFLDDRTWRAVALSGDGNLLLAADLGSGGSQPDGQVLVSRGHRTRTGIDGSLEARQGDSLELQYLGFGRFSVHSASGGPFGVR